MVGKIILESEDWGPAFKGWKEERKQDLGGLVSRPVSFPSPRKSGGEVTWGNMGSETWKQIHLDTGAEEFGVEILKRKETWLA